VSIEGTTKWDLQTCNGYGGPLATPASPVSFLEEAWEAWRAAAAREGGVAAFFRLHPLLSNGRLLPADATVRLDRHTVYVDLRTGLDAAWRQADPRHRNMIRRARQAGAEVTWNDSRGWAAFEELYGEAMKRFGAADCLRFSREYFAQLSRSEFAELACVWDGRDRLSGAAAFLWGPSTMHYHISARQPEAPNYVGNLILQAAVERAAMRGVAGLHLGGGATTNADDSLLRFKRSLGGEQRAFHVARVVADGAAYASLASASPAATWLLPYRQPLTRGTSETRAAR